MKKTVLATSILAVSLLGQGQAVSSVPPNSPYKARAELVLKSFPKAITAFSDLDFDARMELKEKLNQQNGTDDFMELVSKIFDKDGTTKMTLENVNKAYEIIHFGRLLSSVNPQKMKLGDIVSACGFKRLSSFIQHVTNPQNKGKSFLDKKDNLYVSGLIAEGEVFKDILDLYNFNEKVKLWYNLDNELSIYQSKNTKFDMSSKKYWNNLKNKVKLICQKRSLVDAR